MTKRFCDICGEPAIEDIRCEIKHPVGEPYSGYKTTGGGSGCVGTFQCEIEVRVHFAFVDHKSGFGGPPDLCPKCREMLIQKLLGLSET